MLLILQAWYTIGVFYFQQEKFTEALHSFEKANACYEVRTCTYFKLPKNLTKNDRILHHFPKMNWMLLCWLVALY